MAQRNGPRRQPGSSEDEARPALTALEHRIDEALIETFPASDAPYWTLGIEAVSAVHEIGSPVSGLAGGIE